MDLFAFLRAYPLATPFAIALALVVAALAWLSRTNGGTVDLTWPMGSPKWEFTSWASNLTTGSAVATVVMSSVVLASTGAALASRIMYVGLNIAFIGLAAAAPCVFNLIRKAKLDGQAVDYHGYLGMFLLASLLTTWAVYGQLAVFTLVVADASRAKLLDSSIAIPLYALAAVLAIALVPYIVQAIYWTARSQRLPSGETLMAQEAPRPWSLL